MSKSSGSLLCVGDVAKMLNKKESWVRYARRSGILPYIKVGQALRFRMEDLLAWIEERRVPAREAVRPGPRSGSR